MNSRLASAVYSGSVRHRRFTPVRHEFTYQLHLFYLNLDELEELFKDNILWSLNSRNLGWFRRSDYMAPEDKPLKGIVLAEVESQLGSLPANPRVCLLTNLRQWGFCFNPVSFYFVYDDNANLYAIAAQVNNTPWQERHTYVIPADSGRKHKHQFNKQFHVSPFNPIDMQYRWRSTTPDKNLLIHMENHSHGSRHMDATLTLQRIDWSRAILNKILLATPWNTVKIPLAIYWEALRLWVKGTPLYSHQNPPKFNSNVNIRDEGERRRE